MKEIKKIIVTGDIFRVTPESNQAGNQRSNIAWLYHVIRPSLEALTNLPIQVLYFTGDSNCIAKKIYESKGMELSFDSWISLYESQPSPRDLAITESYLGDAFVVGFEICDFTKKALDILEIPYIDFTIHPVRFMDDLIFGVRSNIYGLGGALQEWVIREDEIRIHAGLAHASLARLPPISKFKGKNNAGLFCGQTTDDKVLIRNGRTIQFEELIPEITEMCESHSHIFIKPHPFSPKNPIIMALTRLFPNTEVIDANFYHLLACEEIKSVYSITSSTSIEAAYFGKTGFHLSEYPYVFTEFTAGGGAYLSIDSEIYSQNLWAKILSLAGLRINQRTLVCIKKERSRIRRSLRSFWGADIFEKIL